jgi:hypothetical protein
LREEKDVYLKGRFLDTAEKAAYAQSESEVPLFTDCREGLFSAAELPEMKVLGNWNSYAPELDGRELLEKVWES